MAPYLRLAMERMEIPVARAPGNCLGMCMVGDPTSKIAR